MDNPLEDQTEAQIEPELSVATTSQINTPKIILFVALGVTLCVLIFTFALSQILKVDDKTVVAQHDEGGFPTSRPITPVILEESNLIDPVTQPEGVDTEPDWRDSITEYVYEDGQIYEDEAGGVVDRTASIDDLSHLDLGLNPAPQLPIPTTSPTSTITLTAPATTTPEAMVPVVVEYEVLETTRFDDCGALEVPTGYALTLFPYTAGTEGTVVCMGEAIADKCEASSLDIISDGTNMGTIYVTERNDGVCSVGLSVDDTYVALCSVKAVMNNGTGQNKSISAWQSDFEDDPGTLFASMYFSNTDLFASPTASEEFDCEVYEL